jgi:hypothetical protein
LRFWGSHDRFHGKKRLCRIGFSRNSLRKLTGKLFRRRGNFLAGTGNVIDQNRQRKFEHMTDHSFALSHARAHEMLEGLRQHPRGKIVLRTGPLCARSGRSVSGAVDPRPTLDD